MNHEARYLYQFPLSLYCEKSRWNLEYKNLPYQGVDLIPGFHLPRAMWLCNQSTLPIFRDGNTVVGDSVKIASYLENTYSRRPLLPSEDDDREQALMLEAYFSEVGVHVRRFVWSLAIESENIDELFFNFVGYSSRAQGVGAIGKSILRQMVRRRFQVYDHMLLTSWGCITAAMGYVEMLLDGDPQRYLVSEQFTLADMTAASMLAPLIGPKNSPWEDSHVSVAIGAAEMQFNRARVRASVAGQWVARIYETYR